MYKTCKKFIKIKKKYYNKYYKFKYIIFKYYKKNKRLNGYKYMNKINKIMIPKKKKKKKKKKISKFLAY